MKPNELIYFESVFRTGSIKHAAKELGVSIATVSRTMSSLELTLGYQLFQKDGAKFHIAKNAVDLYGRLIKPVSELNIISREVSSNSSYRIVAPPFLSYKTFSHIATKFEAHFKQRLVIEYSHSIQSRSRAYADLRLGHLDLFIDLKPADEYLLKSTPIYSDSVCLFYSKASMTGDIAGADRRYAKLQWLAPEPCLFNQHLTEQESTQTIIALDCYSDYLDTIATTDNLFGVNFSGAIDAERFGIDPESLADDMQLYSIMNNELILSSGEQRMWLFEELTSINSWVFKM